MLQLHTRTRLHPYQFWRRLSFFTVTAGSLVGVMPGKGWRRVCWFATGLVWPVPDLIATGLVWPVPDLKHVASVRILAQA